ncbi:MAG: hypothetical protein AAFP15_20285, partial [Bacteroidota bacterium]
MERLEAGESRPPRKDHSNEPPKGLRELPRRKSAEVESELLGVKVISVAKAGSFLSMSKERASHEKPSSQAKNYQENPEYVGFKRINLDQSENPHPRVRRRYIRMNDLFGRILQLQPGLVLDDLHAVAGHLDLDPREVAGRLRVRLLGGVVDVVHPAVPDSDARVR